MHEVLWNSCLNKSCEGLKTGLVLKCCWIILFLQAILFHLFAILRIQMRTKEKSARQIHEMTLSMKRIYHLIKHS